MAYIYKITNTINGKVYIRKTLQSIEARFQEHLYNCQHEKCKNRPLYNAMNKYGVENFTIEQIEQCDIDMVSEREVYWINYYHSFVGFDNCTGYNATLGGDGRHYCNYEQIYDLWMQGYNNKQIREITTYDSYTIKIALEKLWYYPRRTSKIHKRKQNQSGGNVR